MMRGWHKRFWMSLRTYSLRRRGILRRAEARYRGLLPQRDLSAAGITANAWASLRGTPRLPVRAVGHSGTRVTGPSDRQRCTIGPSRQLKSMDAHQ